MSFIVNSITQINNYIIRSTFSEAVRANGDGNFNDGLNLINYLVKSPTGTAIVGQINKVPGDATSLDLVFQSILTTGNYLVQFSPNIASADGTSSLSVINNLTLAVNTNLPPTITGSLQAQTAASQLLDNFNPALRGIHWEALFDAIGNTQDMIDANSKLMPDQNFISKAGGAYLDSKLSGINVIRPTNFGLGDSLFQKLGVILANKKLVRTSIEKIINIFYGDIETKAFQQSTNPQPYGLASGYQLYIEIDSSQTVIVTFSSNQFENIGTASAVEVSAVINNVFEINNINAYCTDYFNPNNSLTYLQIFSNNLSLIGNIRILGGQAQNIFQFPEFLGIATESQTWSVTAQSNGLTTLQWISGSIPNLSPIDVGDYLNFYSPSDTNKGTFTVSSVYSDNINNIYYVQYMNPFAITENFYAPDLEFYRPVRAVLPESFAI